MVEICGYFIIDVGELGCGSQEMAGTHETCSADQLASRIQSYINRCGFCFKYPEPYRGIWRSRVIYQGREPAEGDFSHPGGQYEPVPGDHDRGLWWVDVYVKSA